MSSPTSWKPTLTYRYAFFQGDDPDTAANEALIRCSWLTISMWWQGEIAAAFLQLEPEVAICAPRCRRTALAGGLLFFRFSLDQPQSAGPATATDVAFEVDAHADWKLNANFTVSAVGACRSVASRPATHQELRMGWFTWATAFDPRTAWPDWGVKCSSLQRLAETPSSGGEN